MVWHAGVPNSQQRSRKWEECGGSVHFGPIRWEFLVAGWESWHLGCKRDFRPLASNYNRCDLAQIYTLTGATHTKHVTRAPTFFVPCPVALCNLSLKVLPQIKVKGRDDRHLLLLPGSKIPRRGSETKGTWLAFIIEFQWVDFIAYLYPTMSDVQWVLVHFISIPIPAHAQTLTPSTHSWHEQRHIEKSTVDYPLSCPDFPSASSYLPHPQNIPHRLYPSQLPRIREDSNGQLRAAGLPTPKD